jgi:hypothetical protein
MVVNNEKVHALNLEMTNDGDKRSLQKHMKPRGGVTYYVRFLGSKWAFFFKDIFGHNMGHRDLSTIHNCDESG